MCVFEILLIYLLQKHLGETVERGGRDSTLIRVLFVASWIIAEIGGIIGGIAITGDMLGGLVFGFFGVITVCIVFFVIANALPMQDRTRRGGERTYMDDYNEYRMKGRIDTRPIDRDPEEEDDYDRPRRRRRRDEDEDDRPRRRPAPRYDEDDPPRPRRRADDRVARDDEDRPRPRRRRQDEEY